MSRFVRPETTTLPISSGEFLTVKAYLTEGEQRAAYSAMYRGGHSNGDGSPPRINPQEVGIAMVLAFLVDWTVTDDEGRQVLIRDQPAEIVRAALDQLYPDEFDEIQTAIREHEARQLAARQEKKRTPPGARGSDPI